MLTKLWDLAFEIDGDDISLEQDMGCGEVAAISLHRVHLRHLAEEAGLISASAHADVDRTIARLSRQLRCLRDRITQLDDWLHLAEQKGHEDLSLECTYSMATREMATEFCADLDLERGIGFHGDGAAQVTPKELRVTQRHDTSRAVTQGNPPNSGASADASPPKSGGVQSDLLAQIDRSVLGAPTPNAIEGEDA